MRLRRNRGNRGISGDAIPERSLGDDGPLLTLRSAFILTVASICGIGTGVLTYFTTASLPAAFLAVCPAGAGAVTLLNAIIG
jgi:hypothetical protein